QARAAARTFVGHAWQVLLVFADDSAETAPQSPREVSAVAAHEATPAPDKRALPEGQPKLRVFRAWPTAAGMSPAAVSPAPERTPHTPRRPARRGGRRERWRRGKPCR